MTRVALITALGAALVLCGGQAPMQAPTPPTTHGGPLGLRASTNPIKMAQGGLPSDGRRLGEVPCRSVCVYGVTAFGYNALKAVGANTAFGSGVLSSNTTGSLNTAIGGDALLLNTTGNQNTALGHAALQGNRTGAGNIAVGIEALESNDTGSNNTVIGSYAGGYGGNYSNGTAIGYGASLTASNSIVLGNGSITAIYAQVSTITAISDRRHKKEIRALGPISASISSKSSSRSPIGLTMATRLSAMALSRRTSNRPCRPRYTKPSRDRNPNTGWR